MSFAFEKNMYLQIRHCVLPVYFILKTIIMEIHTKNMDTVALAEILMLFP